MSITFGDRLIDSGHYDPPEGEERRRRNYRCDKCGAEGDIRIAGDLLGPHVQFACRKCIGIWTTDWFYLRRPDDFDNDELPL